MSSKKVVFIIILFGVSVSTVVLMNLDLGESTKLIGKVIALKHSFLPVESTKITYGALATQLSLTLSGNLESLFEVGKCYTISTVKRPFQFFPRVIQCNEIEPDERVIEVTGSGYYLRYAVEWTTKIHKGGGTYYFTGKYYDAFEKGKTYRIIFVGEVLLDYSEIT